MHRLFVAALVIVGCGPTGKTVSSPTGTGTGAARVALTPKQIAEQSKPAIVRVESGEDRVGTGFVIDGAGVIATNLHVVASASSIRVRLLDGAVLQVDRIVAFDPEHDLALLGVSGATLPALRLGDSDQVATGDPVLAIGNPLGVLDYTVSDGLISSVRQVTPALKLLQISAPISQGSSGGPLFNSFGDVIGVSTAVFTEGQNLNFGVPSNYITALAKVPQPVTVGDFAELTRPKEPEIIVDGVRIVRKIPSHPDTVFAGCTPTAVAEAAQAIDATISVGAPVYNRGDHEGCFRIYEATAAKLEASSTCKGIRDAFGVGLLRATTMTSPAEKAWAMRDAFDGLIVAVERWSHRAPAP